VPEDTTGGAAEVEEALAWREGPAELAPDLLQPQVVLEAGQPGGQVVAGVVADAVRIGGNRLRVGPGQLLDATRIGGVEALQRRTLAEPVH
jgi:hypothetical protein